MPIKKVLVDKSITSAYKYLKYLGADVQIYGSICVKSEPSQARIYLDGNEVGITTKTITGLEPGKYTVEVRMNGYEVWSESVEVEGGRKKTLTAVLQVKTGVISIKSEPANARIFLDGKEVGTTPDTIQSPVSGSHEVELKLDRYEVWSKRVNVKENKKNTLSAVLRIKAGSLMIESEPSNAKIFLDGEEIGTTPNIIRSIAPDTYEVEVRKNGCEVWSEFVDVEGDKEKVLTAILQLKTGSISVKSKPSNARIFLDGKKVGTTPDILESVATGSHEVEVRKDGYDVSSKSVKVETDKKKSVALELQINTGSISIKSEPVKARIFLDGKEVGTTPDTLLTVTPGRHEVEVRKDRYEVWSESVDVKIGEENTLTPVLQMKTGSIMIDSEPSNAKIYLDGKGVGTSPETVTDLKPGKHTLEIKKARYKVWRESIETEADAVKTLTAVLHTKAGSIIIKSRPSKAKIFLDGKEVGITPDIIRSIEPGTHEVEIRMDGYEIWRERLNVVADKEKALAAELQVKTGALVINSKPENARIYLDGDKVGTAPNTLRYIIPGTHEVEVRMDEYEIWRESIEIEADVRKTLTATLRAKSGTVTIKSKPTNAKIYLDGKEVGNTPVTLKPVRGIHEVEVRMDGYDTWRENVDVQADKEKTLTAALQLKTGTILVKSEPANAKIYLDDKEAGKTPATLRPVCGIHTVEVRADGYEVWRQSVEVEADEEKLLIAALQIKTSSVLVESEPTNATIYLDGDEVGITPDTLKSIIPGKHLVEVKMAGYKVWSKSIMVKANRENTLTAALQILTGSILIESEPAKARIFLDGEEVGTTPESCRYITPGQHEMELKMDKYEVWREIVNVEAGKEKVLTALLQLRTSSILIESEPTKARIYLNGKNIGTTAETITGLTPGKYSVEIRMDGYEVWGKSVEVKADAKNDLTAVLQAKPGSISINSEPTNAKVYLNGKNVGTTAETITDLTPGKHTVEVKLDGYATWHQVVEVDPGKESVLMAALQLKTGSIKIESIPTKAVISLDGEEVGITPDTLWYIISGKHEIIVEMDRYEVWSEIVDVEEDKQKTLTAILQTKTGSIAIESKPSNAVVYLDGEEVGKTPETLRSIVPGTHEVEVRMDSYEVWNKQVNIKPDKVKAITAVLQLKTGSINIISDVTDAKIYIDSEEVGTTPDTIAGLIPGKYAVEVRMEGYEIWSEVVEVEADKENVLTVALQMMAGTISIESAPTNARIFLDGKEIDKTPKIIKNILPGKHLLEARMDGYEDWGEVVDVEAYNDYALKAVLLAKPGSINVKSKPANATIYLDGEEIGITPATITDLMPGEYMLELKMDGYEVWSESINVETNIEKTLTATLQLKTGSIMIDSEPANATIYLDGERIGTTPDIIIRPATPGKHKVEIRKDGYNVWNGSMEIDADKEKSLTAVLQSKIGSIMIDSVPANATVYLDGEEIGTTPDTLISATPGIHEIEVKMDGYEVWSKTVNVKADKNKTLTAVLRITTGAIKINSEPANATIYLDGKKVGKTPDTIRSIAPGTHEVEVRMKGHEKWKKSVKVNVGKEEVLTALLLVETGSILIESTPPNADIYLDGEKAGTTPDTLLSIIPDQHEVEVKMDGYEAWSENVVVETNKETSLTVALKLKTGSLSIKSNPSKAKVFLNGEDIGTLPKTLTDLIPGKYTVEVSMDEYELWSETVDIEADLKKTLTAELQMKAGSINIESKPAKAKVYLDDEEVGITPAILKSVSPGTHEIEVRMDGYDVWSEIVEIEAEKEKTLTPVLRMRTGSFSVNSEPANAKIYLDGDYIGNTPDIIKSGVLGTHVVEIREEGYEVWREIVNIKVGEGNAITAALQLMTGTFTIESNPSMAMVYIDDREVGITPATLTDLKSGKYNVEIKMDGYRTWGKRVNVKANIENTVTAALSLNTGSIMIDSEPTKAHIFLNGKEVGTTPETISVLDPGKYNVEVKLDGYEVWSKSTKVKIGKESILKAALQIKSGSVSINSKPSNARIYIDGEDVGITPGIIKSIDSGTHEVEVKKDGYETWSESVDIEADKEKSLTVRLRIKTISISIDSNPSGAVIYLDGEEVGTTPENLTGLKPAKYSVEVMMDGYELWTEIVDVKADIENTLTAVLQKKTGSISVKSRPSKAKIFLNGEDASVTPVILKSVNPGAHKIEVRMDGYESWSKSVDVEADKENALTAILQIKTCSINIKSEPTKASIFLDGKEVGTTPENLTGLKPAKYSVEVMMDGYELWTEIVDVKADIENTLTAVLQKKTGSISVKSRPSKAKIFLNGEAAGTVPKILNDLNPGKYTVEVMMDGYDIWSESVDVEANKENALTAILQIKTCSINIKSEPAKASIFLDGEEVGTTPENLTGLKPAKYTVEVRRDGYETWREIVDIEADNDNALTAALQIKTTTISIKSKPSKANIFIDGNDAGITPGIIKSVTPGKHEIEVRMDGYEIWSESVDVVADKENTITAALQTKSSSISIKSEPANARIYLDGKEVGTTPVALKSVVPGTHEVEVRMDGYEIWSESVDVVADKEIVLTAALQLKTGSIMIDSEPANATIYIDGEKAGTTPKIIVRPVTPGKYKVEIRKDGYNVWSGSMEIDADNEKSLNAVLQSKTGSIMIDSVPASATIYLDGKKTGTTPDTLMSATPGIHKIEVKMDGYEVWSKMVNVKADKNKALTAALQKMAGSISIESEPAKASIFIDGKEFGRTPAMRKSIDHGKHEVEVRMEGYKVWSKIVNLKAGKEKLLTATLQIMSGVIRVESTPTKAMIYLDGKDVGTTPDILRSVAPGTHEVKVKMEGYKVWSKKLDVEEGKENSLTAALQKESSPVGIKRESSSKKRIRLRSTYENLSASQIQSLPHISIRERHKQVFLCHSTISHNYEVKTISGDEIVIDHATELVWHQSGSSEYMDMRKVKKWLRKLNHGGYSGYHDWRLPTLEEASTLLELEMENDKFINPVFDKKQWGMWTDDRVDKNHAWIVTFVNGTINQSHIGSPATFVRPVRLLK